MKKAILKDKLTSAFIKKLTGFITKESEKYVVGLLRQARKEGVKPAKKRKTVKSKKQK